MHTTFFFELVLLVFLALAAFPGVRARHIAVMLALTAWFVIERKVIGRPSHLFILCVAGGACLPALALSALEKRRGLFLCLSGLLGVLLLVLTAYDAALLAYFLPFGKLCGEQFAGLLQTNLREAWENAPLYVGWRFWGLFLALMALTLIPFPLARLPLPVAARAAWRRYALSGRRKTFGLLGLLCLLSAAAGVVLWENRMGLSLRAHPLYSVFQEKMRFETQLAARVRPPRSSAVLRNGEVYVLVIGESASAAHMSAYGYFRDTTPWMRASAASGAAVLFSRAFSVHTHTALTVPLMLSECQWPAFAQVPQRPTILNVMAKAGYATAWLSAQERFGPFVNGISMLADEADTVVFSSGITSKGKIGDHALLDSLDERLRTDTDRGLFAVLHLMGSHSMYRERFPADFKPLPEESRKGVWGVHPSPKLSSINAYDTSIAYTDALLRKLAERIAASGRPGVVLYAADHGESVVGAYSHSSALENNPDMSRVPLLIWANPAFAAAHADRLARLRRHARDYVTNDRVYELLLFLAGARPDVADVFVQDRCAVRLRHGESGLGDMLSGVAADKLDALRAATGKVYLLHRANSLKKLVIAAESGFDGVEIDVLYDAAADDLRVGHDRDSAAEVSLAVFLQSMEAWPAARLWLDMKDLRPDTAGGIRALLEKLDARYRIRGRAIVESSAPDAWLEPWVRDGWFVSWYLPTLGDKSRPEERQTTCAAIRDTLKRFPVSGLSFDLSTLKALEPICPVPFAEKPLNVWGVPRIDLRRDGAVAPLLRDPLLRHPRLDCVLISMPTEADL